MNPIATYAFLDLGTTGLRTQGEPSITRLRIIAVNRRDFCNANEWPQEIEICFKPEYECDDMISRDIFYSIKSLIKNSEKPVCLISHNGFEFHFPLLKYYFEMINKTLPNNLMCTDSLYAFYDIREGAKNGNTSGFLTSGKQKIKTQSFFKLKRDRYYGENGAPAQSYRYQDIYDGVMGCYELEPREKETRNCYMIKDIAMSEYIAEEFVEWVDGNHCPFADVPI